MIARLMPETYDVEGRSVSAVSKKHREMFEPNFPIGRYVSQPLKYQCRSLADMRGFLRACKYVSDQKQFGRPDFWQPPEQFEKTRKGDCDDFAMWTWRQLMAMGFQARYVVGTAGRYGEGHAWAAFKRAGNWYLVETQDTMPWLPRLSTLRYQPIGSVEWRGGKPQYFVHEAPQSSVALWRLVPLSLAWAGTQVIWFLRWLLVLVLFPILLPAAWIRGRLRRSAK